MASTTTAAPITAQPKFGNIEHYAPTQKDCTLLRCILGFDKSNRSSYGTVHANWDVLSILNGYPPTTPAEVDTKLRHFQTLGWVKVEQVPPPKGVVYSLTRDALKQLQYIREAAAAKK